MSPILVQFLWSAGLDFSATGNFPGIFVDFWFMMLPQVLMKELARILIHVRKIFNWNKIFLLKHILRFWI